MKELGKCCRCIKQGFYCEQDFDRKRAIVDTKTKERLDLFNRIEDCPTVADSQLDRARFGNHNRKKI